MEAACASFIDNPLWWRTYGQRMEVEGGLPGRGSRMAKILDGGGLKSR